MEPQKQADIQCRVVRLERDYQSIYMNLENNTYPVRQIQALNGIVQQIHVSSHTIVKH